MSVSCRSHNVPRIAQIDTDRYESHFLQRVDMVVVRDSVFVSEVMKGDTVYLTRVEWQDRWQTRVERDTVVDVRVEKEVCNYRQSGMCRSSIGGAPSPVGDWDLGTRLWAIAVVHEMAARW